MIYNIINSKICLARVFDRFNIDYAGFVNRVPNWIYSAMNELDMILPLMDETVDVSVVDFKCAIPPQTRKLLGVSYEGLRLFRRSGINETVSTNMSTLVFGNFGYAISGNYIIVDFETGDVKFYIKSLPVIYDEANRIYFPYVPDNEESLIALDWYILRRLLERGHSVPGYSLKDNNEFTNPALAWEKHKRIARNSVSMLDDDSRQEISMMLKSFLIDYDYYSSTNFNPNIIIP